MEISVLMPFLYHSLKPFAIYTVYRHHQLIRLHLSSMASYNHSHFHCNNTVTQLFNQCSSSLRNDLQNLMHFCVIGYESQANEKFSKPLVWIGVYIAIASLFCTVAMGADIFRSFVNDIVPGKYFSLNAASITVISIAMKLPLDMTGSMPGVLDQVAKLGGLAFMCTMMANLIPSLASMDNKDLVANIIGLAILVITIIGNISVEIYTGVIGDHMGSRFRTILVTMAFWYVAMMLLLLVSISTAIIIPRTKKNLELKYKERRETLVQRTTLSEEELKRNVTRYWIMAKSGSPQFIMAGTYLAYTSTLICVINAGLFCALFFGTLNGNIRSDYGLAIRIILVIQFVGIIIGTLALVSRCITSLSYRKSRTDLEGNSVSKLSEWKRSCIAFLSSGGRTRAFVQRMKYFIISLCIGLHIAVFSLCRITGSLFEYFYLTLRKFTTPKDESIEKNDDDLKKYVLCIEVISQRALKGLLNSMESLIQKAEKQQNGNFLELLQKSGLFDDEGRWVNNFDIYHVPDLPSFKLNSWSLPVVTLICIAIHIPGISEDKIVKLIDAVDEALKYIHLVEESFKSANKHENLLNTAIMTVWYEVKENPNWDFNPMQICPDWEEKKLADILNWFEDKGNSVSPGSIQDAATTTYFRHFPDYKVIAGHSMKYISNQIKLRYRNTISGCTNDRFFELLRTMIADILCACLTNIPQAIMRKCHSDAIEKREASVEAAVELLGRTTDIREFLNGHASRLPRRITTINCWHTHFGDHA